jgi:hypothetical protein
MEIYDKIIYIAFVLFIIFVIFLVMFKHLYNINAFEAIFNFNESYKSLVNKIYMYFHYDKKTETLHTNYELNNGLFTDIKNNLRYLRL